MDAIVQLIRNALCCCKDLRIFEGTALHDAATTQRLLGEFFTVLPNPMNKTTPLEILISITQMYACMSCTRSGLKLFTTSIGKLKRIIRMVEHRFLSPKQKDWTSKADRIINESLIKEAKVAIRSAFVGTLVFPLGIAFFWLAANSWHVTETNWIGGLPALIYALIVMEIALVPLLYFMISDGFELIAKSKKSQELVKNIEGGKLSPEDITIQQYEIMTEWAPFWHTGVSIFDNADTNEEKQIQDEVKQVQETLTNWFPVDKKKDKKEDKEKSIKENAIMEAKSKVQDSIPQFQLEGYREFLYFIFNFIAFYGYLMGPLVFFYDQEQNQPFYVQSLKFFYDNDSADWVGNFAGDLMWTVEPMVILTSPFLIQWIIKSQQSKEKKVKSD